MNINNPFPKKEIGSASKDVWLEAEPSQETFHDQVKEARGPFPSWQKLVYQASIFTSNSNQILQYIDLYEELYKYGSITTSIGKEKRKIFRKISLRKAQELAISALEDAENRRRESAEAESRFIESLLGDFEED